MSAPRVQPPKKKKGKKRKGKKGKKASKKKFAESTDNKLAFVKNNAPLVAHHITIKDGIETLYCHREPQPNQTAKPPTNKPTAQPKMNMVTQLKPWQLKAIKNMGGILQVFVDESDEESKEETKQQEQTEPQKPKKGKKGKGKKKTASAPKASQPQTLQTTSP